MSVSYKIRTQSLLQIRCFPHQECTRIPSVGDDFLRLSGSSLPGGLDLPLKDEPVPQLPLELQAGQLLVAVATHLGIVAQHVGHGRLQQAATAQSTGSFGASDPSNPHYQREM